MYAKEMTEASRSALLELGLELKRYHNDMVLTGGWAPYFITKDFFDHCGSIDIDLVLRTEVMLKYDTIKKSVIRLGYSQENEFRFSRTVKSPVDGKDYGIHLDFLCDKEGAKYVDLKNVQADLQAFTTSFTLCLSPILPGLMRILSTPCLAASTASCQSKAFHALPTTSPQMPAW